MEGLGFKLKLLSIYKGCQITKHVSLTATPPQIVVKTLFKRPVTLKKQVIKFSEFYFYNKKITKNNVESISLSGTK